MSWMGVSAIAKNKLAAPVVKWVGGKRQLLDEIAPRLPKRITTYCEPFLGGGAVLFSLQPKTAIVNDLNADLMLVYEVIRDDVELLIAALAQHENTAEYFYNIRDLDRDKNAYREMTAVERASRIIYLNKTCYNGLFRVNASGEFNSPFGHYKNPNIVNVPVLRAVSKYLTANNIQLLHMDFEEVLQRVPRGGALFILTLPMTLFQIQPVLPVTIGVDLAGRSKRGLSAAVMNWQHVGCDSYSPIPQHHSLRNCILDTLLKSFMLKEL